jgi:hypothetical protein
MSIHRLYVLTRQLFCPVTWKTWGLRLAPVGKSHVAAALSSQEPEKRGVPSHCVGLASNAQLCHPMCALLGAMGAGGPRTRHCEAV